MIVALVLAIGIAVSYWQSVKADQEGDFVRSDILLAACAFFVIAAAMRTWLVLG